jgi:hypothetical protein
MQLSERLRDLLPTAAMTPDTEGAYAVRDAVLRLHSWSRWNWRTGARGLGTEDAVDEGAAVLQPVQVLLHGGHHRCQLPRAAESRSAAATIVASCRGLLRVGAVVMNVSNAGNACRTPQQVLSPCANAAKVGANSLGTRSSST